MTPQKLLHFAEFPFQQIARIRDAQLGKTLAGKQPWQMPFQAVVRSAQTLIANQLIFSYDIYANLSAFAQYSGKVCMKD